MFGLFSKKPEKKEIVMATNAQELDSLLRSFVTTTAAGIAVTPRNALKCGPYFSAVRNLAEGVAKLPQILNKRDGEGWSRAKEHPLYNLLRYRWNRSLSAFDGKAMMIIHLMTYGDFFARKVWTGNIKNKTAAIQELHPLMPWAMKVKQRDNLSIYFEHTLDGGAKKTYEADDIFHVRYLTLDGVTSISPVEAMKESIALMTAADKFAALHFVNGAHPGGAIRSKKKLDIPTKDWLREQINLKFSGDNAHRMMLLDDEMDFQPIAHNSHDSQLNETRTTERTALAASIGVQPHKIGELTRATHNNIAEQQQEHYSDTLLPILERIDQRVKIDLLWPWEFEEYKSEHLVDAVLRADISKRFAAYQIALMNGVMSSNEVRSKENMNPREDGFGDVYFQPINMVPAGTPPATEGEEPSKNPEDPDAEVLKRLADVGRQNGNGAHTN